MLKFIVEIIRKDGNKSEKLKVKRRYLLFDYFSVFKVEN